jgi:hypothetical protein
MTKLFLLAVVTSLTPCFLIAQTAQPSPGESTPLAAPIWKCTLPGGTYEVALRSIVSVSVHEYLANGVARVNEVNIDTAGSALVRFYFLEPVTPNSPIGLGQSAIEKAKEVLEQAAERAGQEEVWKKVVKDYPTSTHAHTIEYRVETKEQLDKIFKSAELAFRTGRGSALTIP